MNLNTEIKYLKGVGEKLAARLKTLGIITIQDFFETYPRDYDDRRKLPKIKDLKPGEEGTLIVKIRTLKENPHIKKKPLIAKIQDETGEIDAIWFNQSYLTKTLKAGQPIILSGKLTINNFTGLKQLQISETEIPKTQTALQKSKRVTPIYALAKGLYQSKMREIAETLIEKHLSLIRDPFSPAFRQSYELIPKAIAIKQIHFPESREAYKAAKHRLSFDELFFLQLPYIMRKLQVKIQTHASPLSMDHPLLKTYMKSIPYELTSAQKNAINDISSDITSTSPMNRLLQGDVGAGKTDVAIVALLSAVAAEKKAAFLVPTEILALQHTHKLTERLAPLGITICQLKGKMKAKEKRETLEKLASDQPLIVVGTHALISNAVEIKDLALVVLDEQHRFGVNQRMTLSEKGDTPHALYMTATPIPRSLMLSIYGDLEKTIIDELPKGRIPPQTILIKEENMAPIYTHIKTELEKGHQIFIVYPLVEESEKLDLKSATEGHELFKEKFPDHEIALIHGRMHPDEKSIIMKDFKAKKSQILVATTVIEVGIDVPNANTIIIMNAQRFGLSQLHQLRGRVGRGTTASHCILSATIASETTAKRLTAMQKTTDGFKLAEYDLQIRGPGDMLGTRQSGIDTLTLSSLTTATTTLQKAKSAAETLLTHDPELITPQNTAIKTELESKTNFKITNPLN